MSEFAKVKKSMEDASKLLEEPQPGLMTWNRMLLERFLEVQEALAELGLTPDVAERLNKEIRQRG